MEYRIDGSAVTIIARWPKIKSPGEFRDVPIARFRYVRSIDVWALYWEDRGQWHLYRHAPPTRDLRALVAEVERDPNVVFMASVPTADRA